MFVLAEMTDTVRIEPWLFNVTLNDAITEELNKKLANKVGLMISHTFANTSVSKHGEYKGFLLHKNGIKYESTGPYHSKAILASSFKCCCVFGLLF